MYNYKIALNYFLFLRITVMFVESEVRNGESHLKYKMVKRSIHSSKFEVKTYSFAIINRNGNFQLTNFN